METNNIIMALACLGLCCSCLYKLKTSQKHRGMNGFGAGFFLVNFINHASPIAASLIMKFWWK